MKNSIAIIGAGVGGLTAALQLETLGHSTTIFEADAKLGGRVQSEVVDGYVLDKGFQVLLTAYPMVKKYLDFEPLQLQKFSSGSYIFNKNGKSCIGDPLRDISLLIPTLLSSVANFADKWRILKLTKKLKKKSITSIFEDSEITTAAYLKNFGFSDTVINNFFKPFFSGIFLETELRTSSRMFEFIFKMFAEGEAAIPKAGIEDIPKQLASKLQKSAIKFNSKVMKVSASNITFEDGSTQDFDYCIVATEASKIIPNLANTLSWKSTRTLYFSVNQDMVFSKNMIGLLAEPSALINSISFPYAGDSREKLLSVSVVKSHQFTNLELVKEATKELDTYFNIVPIKYLKTFDIPFALPDLKDVKYNISPTETRLTDTIFLAGDTILNGSLNAAMLAGELAATAIDEKINGVIMH